MKLKNRFFSTYAKVMISQYGPICKVLKANVEDFKQDQKILSSQQINEVLSGPYGNFLRLVIPAYATFNKFISGLNLTQDTLFKTKRININEEIKLPNHLKNYSLTKTTALEKKLNKLITEGYQTWQTQLSEWKNELLTSIKSIDFPLSEIERREFQSSETISTVLNQFTEFKINIPKINFHPLSIHDYLTLKVYLSIHNSLARRQRPSANIDVITVFKKLSPAFSKIMKKEKQILSMQKKELDELIRPIRF